MAKGRPPRALPLDALLPTVRLAMLCARVARSARHTMLKRYNALQRVRRSRSSSWPATPSDAPARGAAHVLFAE
eukprot:4058582-Prymnesium_polylepis.1